LKDLLGSRFDLVVDATGATPESGDVVVALESDAAKMHFSGRFEGGEFHLSSAPDQGLTLPLPRGYIDAFVTPRLPPGSKLVFAAGAKSSAAGGPASPMWTLRVSRLELPIPDLGARDLKALAPYLARSTCDAEIDLPADIGFESPALPPASGTPVLRRTRFGVHVAPHEPLALGLTAELDMNGKSNLGAELKLRDPWTALAAGSMPPADAHLELTDVGTAVLDALAQQGGKIAGALGPKVSLRVRAKDLSADSGSFAVEIGAEHLDIALAGKLESGRVRCSGTDGLTLRFEPPADWLATEMAAHVPAGIEIAVDPGPLKVEVRDVTFVLPAGSGSKGDVIGLVRGALACQLSCDLPGLRVANQNTREANVPIAVGASHLVMNLALDGKCVLGLKATLDTGAKGGIVVAGTAADVWKLAALDVLKSAPGIEAKLSIDGVSTAAIDRLVGRDGFATGLLGPSVSVSLEGHHADSDAMAVRLDVQAPRLKVGFAGKLNSEALRCTGEEGLTLEADPASDLIARELAPYLPAGTRVVLSEARAGNDAQSSPAKSPIRMSVREVSLPLPDSRPNAKLGLPEFAALMERASGVLRLDVGRLVYSAARTQASKIDVALDALALKVDLAPKKPLVIQMNAALEAGGTGALRAEVSLKDPWLALRTPPMSVPPLDAKLAITGLPSATLDAFAGQKEMLAKLFGPAIAIEAGASTKSLDEGSFHLDLESPTTKLTSSGRLDKGALVCSGTQGLDLSIHLPPGWLEGQISPMLPAGARLSVPSDAAPLTLTVRDVRIELLKSNAAAPASEPHAPADARGKGAKEATGSSSAAMRSVLTMVSTLALRASFTAPTLIYADAKTDAAKQPVSIRDFNAAIDLVPGQPPSATLSAKIEAETPGHIEVEVRALDPLAKLADENGADTYRVALDVGATQVPTAIIDALAGQDGLIAGALGERLEMTVKSESLSREQGAFVVSLSSDQHSMHLVEGHLEHGDLVIDKDGGLVAKVGLSPLVSKRLVGNLVPMLVDVKKPEGSAPAVFSIDSLRWPKDGDIGKLDAVVRVDLGEVSYRLLPGLEAVFGSSVPKLVKIPELRVPIQHGVASYAGLPIKIGGRDFSFKGSFNLKDQSFNLATDVPLSVLGKNVEKQLDNLRGVLGPDTLVPIEIRGTWKSPRVGIGNDFLKRALEDAAKSVLPGLLEGLLKKKKKD
jgi:hypothetical protein